MKTILNLLIALSNTTETGVERQSIKNEICFRHYQATATERSVVSDAMQPFFGEIAQGLIEKDPLAREAYELLNQHRTTKATLIR